MEDHVEVAVGGQGQRELDEGVGWDVRACDFYWDVFCHAAGELFAEETGDDVGDWEAHLHHLV